VLRKLIPDQNAADTTGLNPKVWLIKPAPRWPVSDVEWLAVAVLRHESAISLNALVNRVAHELYLEELAMGAGILDIGLFGPKLFVHDVTAELNAANGILWHIES
jgi:hypothetical protein